MQTIVPVEKGRRVTDVGGKACTQDFLDPPIHPRATMVIKYIAEAWEHMMLAGIDRYLAEVVGVCCSRNERSIFMRFHACWTSMLPVMKVLGQTSDVGGSYIQLSVYIMRRKDGY